MNAKPSKRTRRLPDVNAENPGSDPNEAIREYATPGIVVTWESGRCQHSTECVRGLPKVFDTTARPWIDPNGAAVDALVEVIDLVRVTRSATGRTTVGHALAREPETGPSSLPSSQRADSLRSWAASVLAVFDEHDLGLGLAANSAVAASLASLVSRSSLACSGVELGSGESCAARMQLMAGPRHVGLPPFAIERGVHLLDQHFALLHGLRTLRPASGEAHGVPQ